MGEILTQCSFNKEMCWAPWIYQHAARWLVFQSLAENLHKPQSDEESRSRYTCTLISHYYPNMTIFWIGQVTAYSVWIFRIWPFSEYSIFRLSRYYSGFRSIFWRCIQRIRNMGLNCLFFLTAVSDSCLFTAYGHLCALLWLLYTSQQFARLQ